MVSLILLAIAAPVLTEMAGDWLFPMNDFTIALAGFCIPILAAFISLCLFYKRASARQTRFAEVWIAALCATMLLQVAESLFLHRVTATVLRPYDFCQGICQFWCCVKIPAIS